MSGEQMAHHPIKGHSPSGQDRRGLAWAKSALLVLLGNVPHYGTSTALIAWNTFGQLAARRIRPILYSRG